MLSEEQKWFGRSSNGAQTEAGRGYEKEKGRVEEGDQQWVRDCVTE